MIIEMCDDKLWISHGFEDYQTLEFISKSIPVKFCLIYNLEDCQDETGNCKLSIKLMGFCYNVVIRRAGA